MRELIQDLCPPFVWRYLKRARVAMAARAAKGADSSKQDLDVYWDENMATLLKTDIPFVHKTKQGNDLDIEMVKNQVLPAIVNRAVDCDTIVLDSYSFMAYRAVVKQTRRATSSRPVSASGPRASKRSRGRSPGGRSLMDGIH